MLGAMPAALPQPGPRAKPLSVLTCAPQAHVPVPGVPGKGNSWLLYPDTPRMLQSISLQRGGDAADLPVGLSPKPWGPLG